MKAITGGNGSENVVWHCLINFTVRMENLIYLRLKPQGQYWAGRTPPPNNSPPNMAAANFVMAEVCRLNGTAIAAVFIDQ